MRRFALLLAIAMLAAGAVRAGSVEVDFDPKAPFERYKTWGWTKDRDRRHYGLLADATMRDRVEKALAGRLGEAGLRPAGPGETPDVLVRYEGDVGSGDTVTMAEGYYYGGMGPPVRQVRFEEQIVTIVVDLFDGSTSTLAWRLYIHQKFKGPNDPPDKLQKAVDKGFAQYPPSESARAKKAKQLEKASRAK